MISATFPASSGEGAAAQGRWPATQTLPGCNPAGFGTFYRRQREASYGAGSGIGRAAVAGEGARVGVLSHTADEVQATVDEIRRLRGDALALIADVADAEAVRAAVDRGERGSRLSRAPYREGERTERGEVTLEEAAEALKVSEATVRRLIVDKVLPAAQHCKGAPWVIRAANLQDENVKRAADARRQRRPASPDQRQNVLAL